MKTLSVRYRPSSSRNMDNQHGQAAVETALLLPVLFVLLFGIIMSGFAFYAFIQVSNATREGARAGSLYRMSQANSGLSLEQTVKNAIYDSGGESALGYLDTGSPSFDVDSDVVVSLVDADGDGVPSSGDRLTVTVNYRYTLPLVSDLVPAFPQPIVIQRVVRMVLQ